MPNRPVNDLHRSTLIVLLSAIFIGYIVSVLVLGQERTVEAGNIIRLSLWSGAAIASFPSAVSAFRHPRLDGAAILALGIFFGGFGVVYQTLGSVAWRLVGKPPEWVDSWLWGLHIAIFSCSAACILLGPEATNGKVPTKQWLKIGVYVAASMMLFGIAALFQFG